MSDERETALREAIDRAEHALAACDTTRPARRREAVSPQTLIALAAQIEAKLNVARHGLHPASGPLVDRVPALTVELRDAALRLAIERAEETGNDDDEEAETQIAIAMREASDPALLSLAREVGSRVGARALERALEALERQRTPATRSAVIAAASAAENRSLVPASRLEEAWRAVLDSDARAEGGIGVDTAWSTERLAMHLESTGHRARARAEREAYVARAEAGGAGDRAETLRMSYRLLRGHAPAPTESMREPARALLARIERAPRKIQRELELERSELRYVLTELSRHDPAAQERLLRQAVDAARRDHGRTSSSHAWAVRALGLFYVDERRFDEAERTLRAAREILASPRVRNEPHDPPGPRLVDLDLVRVAIARGDRRAAEARFASLVPEQSTLRKIHDAELAPLREAIAKMPATDPTVAGPAPVLAPLPRRMRQPKLGLVGEVIEREGGKVRLRLDDGSERTFLESKLEPAD